MGLAQENQVTGATVEHRTQYSLALGLIYSDCGTLPRRDIFTIMTLA